MTKPCQSLLEKLENDKTPFNIINFLSSDNGNKPLLKLTNERFEKVVNTLKRYYKSPSETITLNDIYPYMLTMLEDSLKIETIERPKRKELIELAINLVIEETGINKDLINFDVRLIDSFITNPSNKIIINKSKPTNNNIDSNKHLKERGKRRLINAITAGVGELSHYMYHMVGDELTNILGYDGIINDYSKMMSLNDLMYWLVDDESYFFAGKVNVEVISGKPTINVVAYNFPILLHELIKGIYEVISIHGLPIDTDVMNHVVEMEDTIEKELWDLRIGPTIWEKINKQIPIETLNDKEIIQFMLMNIYKLPPDDFFDLINKVINDNAEIELKRIMRDSKTLLMEYRFDM